MIPAREAIDAINLHRNDAVVVSTMTPMQLWARVSQRQELDLPILGCMGKASSVALGLALARPDRKVITLDGDGCLLMNLGSLVTISNKRPSNFVHIVFQDGGYFTTGGQPIPGQQMVDFAAIARGAGFPFSYDFSNLEEFVSQLPDIMRGQGPTLVCLRVDFGEHPQWVQMNTRQAMRTLAEAIK